MSYRVRVNGKQIFGNNDTYLEWDDFLISQGIEISEEGCYDGYITDFMGAMETIEKIVMRIEAERDETRKKLLAAMKKNDNPDVIASQQAVLKRYATSLFDLSDIKERILEEDQNKRDYLFDALFDITKYGYLFDALFDITKYGYLFFPMNLYWACEKDLEFRMSSARRLREYYLKPGCKIHVKAS